jgi:hypothetical protein
MVEQQISTIACAFGCHRPKVFCPNAGFTAHIALVHTTGSYFGAAGDGYPSCLFFWFLFGYTLYRCGEYIVLQMQLFESLSVVVFQYTPNQYLHNISIV